LSGPRERGYTLLKRKKIGPCLGKTMHGNLPFLEIDDINIIIVASEDYKTI